MSLGPEWELLQPEEKIFLDKFRETKKKLEQERDAAGSTKRKKNNQQRNPYTSTKRRKPLSGKANRLNPVLPCQLTRLLALAPFLFRRLPVTQSCTNTDLCLCGADVGLLYG